MFHEFIYEFGFTKVPDVHATFEEIHLGRGNHYTEHSIIKRILKR